MAYSVPKQWAHGDTVTHTNMQKYSDDLDAVYAKTGAAKLNYAILGSYAIFDAVNFEDSMYSFIHRKRFLWFRSSGAIVDPLRFADPAGLAGEDDITISETETDYGIYDLDSVNWLVYGALYFVTGVTVALEYE
jgi:hypothetical protein